MWHHNQKMTYIHCDTQDSVNSIDSFAPTFLLSNVIRRPHKIFLKSAEIPVSFTNIRASNYTNYFTILSHGRIAQILIPEQQYNLTSLLVMINSQIKDSGVFTDTNIPVFTFSNGYVSIVAQDAGTQGLAIGWTGSAPSNLVRTILGFNMFPNGYTLNGISLQLNQYSTSSTMTAVNSFNLAYDTYLSINLINIPALSSNSTNNKLISFKMPLNVQNGMLYYQADQTSFHQFVEITDQNFVLNRIQLQVYDRFNCPVMNNGVDWSFTLAVLSQPE